MFGVKQVDKDTSQFILTTSRMQIITVTYLQCSHRGNTYFTLVISVFYLLLLICQLRSELTEQNSLELFYKLESEPDWKMHIQNVRCPLPLKWGPKTTYFRRFSMTLQFNGNFNGEYL